MDHLAIFIRSILLTPLVAGLIYFFGSVLKSALFGGSNRPSDPDDPHRRR